MEANNEDILNKEKCNCIIELILDKNLSSNTHMDKTAIIRSGRPTPDILLTEKMKNCIQEFNKVQYERTKWLTGCAGLQKLYCWPCLLFNNEVGTWTLSAFTDLNNLHKAIKRHEVSASHITSTMDLLRYGKTQNDFLLSKQHEKNVEIHNADVKNRDIIKQVIDVVCYLCEQQYAFSGDDKSRNSKNKDNFVELLNLCNEHDPLLEFHLEESVLSGVSDGIENDLINCISKVLSEKIKREIQEATFASIILDETTDSKILSQHSCVVRYTLSDGKMCERFLGFVKVNGDRTAEIISIIVFRIVEELDIREKLVAQTYEGASVMSSELNGLQKKVKEKCPNAIFIHLMTHRLNLVLLQCVSKIRVCDTFLSKLNVFSLFFTKSTAGIHLLDTEIKKRFSKVEPTHWNLKHSLLEIVFEYREHLLDLVQTIMDNSSDYDTDSYSYAQVLYPSFGDFEFNFLLNVFGDILNYINSVFDDLQSKTFDISLCIYKVKEMVTVLQCKRNEFPKYWSTVDGIYPLPKRKTINPNSDSKEIYKRIFCNIIDLICEQIAIRFKNLNKLTFFHLLDTREEAAIKNHLIDSSLTQLKYAYGKFFNCQGLKSELLVLYNDKELKGKQVDELLPFLRSSGLDEALPELTKLCELILTLPTTSASSERSFSFLRRVPDYPRSEQEQERLSSLALIALEKDLLRSIKNEKFYSDVISLIKEKERSSELTFK